MDAKTIIMTVVGVSLGIVLASVIQKKMGMSNYESDGILS